MKRYLVKKTYTALRSNSIYNKGDKMVYYIGKASKSYDELCDYIKELGWQKKYFAEHYIETDKDFTTRFESDFWQVDYEIIEVEDNEN